jgi:hypothetical protein
MYLKTCQLGGLKFVPGPDLRLAVSAVTHNAKVLLIKKKDTIITIIMLKRALLIFKCPF